MVTQSTLQNANYLQPSGFKISINRKRFPNLEFFAQRVTHPSVSLTQAQVPYKRSDVFYPGDKLDFGEFSIDAIMDENMQVYNEIYQWISSLVQSPDYNNPTLDEDKSTYDMTVSILSSHNNVTNSIIYKNIFPTTIGTVDLNSQATGNDPVVVPITFSYTTFEMKKFT